MLTRRCCEIQKSITVCQSCDECCYFGSSLPPKRHLWPTLASSPQGLNEFCKWMDCLCSQPPLYLHGRGLCRINRNIEGVRFLSTAPRTRDIRIQEGPDQIGTFGSLDPCWCALVVTVCLRDQSAEKPSFWTWVLGKAQLQRRKRAVR